MRVCELERGLLLLLLHAFCAIVLGGVGIDWMSTCALLVVGILLLVYEVSSFENQQAVHDAAMFRVCNVEMIL
jgi:hypothetical protein